MSYTVHALATRLWGMVGQGEGDRIVTALPPEDDPATVDLQAVLPGDGSPGMLLIGEVDASGFGFAEKTSLAVLELFQACKEIEDSDGGWNGGDVVEIVCEWFARHGIDVDKGPEVYGGTKIDYDWDDEDTL